MLCLGLYLNILETIQKILQFWYKKFSTSFQRKKLSVHSYPHQFLKLKPSHSMPGHPYFRQPWPQYINQEYELKYFLVYIRIRNYFTMCQRQSHSNIHTDFLAFLKFLQLQCGGRPHFEKPCFMLPYRAISRRPRET